MGLFHSTLVSAFNHYCTLWLLSVRACNNLQQENMQLTNVRLITTSKLTLPTHKCTCAKNNWYSFHLLTP